MHATNLARNLALSEAGGTVLHLSNMMMGGAAVSRFGRRGNSLSTRGALVRRMRGIMAGRNNTIHISPLARVGDLQLTIRGENHQVRIGPSVSVGRCHLWLEGIGSSIEIGERTTIESAVLAATESRSISIGERCMLSTDVQIRTGDSHPIYDIASGLRMNAAQDVEIGDEVWLGEGVVVLKGVALASNVIVGTRSVVTRSVGDGHVIIAGSPARTIKSNATWLREPPVMESQAEQPCPSAHQHQASRQ